MLYSLYWGIVSKKNGVVLDESEALVVSRFEMLQTNVGLA